MTAAKPKKKEQTTIKVQLTETINVVLSDEERAHRAKAASELHGEVEKREFSLKLANENEKKEIKALKTKMNQAAQSHNSGKEYQSVKCVRIYDVKLKETWLLYKNVEYLRRPMSADECNKANKDLFGKSDLQLKDKKAKPRNADEIAKDVADIGKDKAASEKLPPELGNAKANKKSKAKAPKLAAVPSAPPAEDETPSAREELGYTDPKKNGGKS